MTKLENKLDRLEAQRERIGEAIAEKIALRDELEQKVSDKEAREPKSAERQRKIDREVEAYRREIEAYDKQIRRARGRRSQVSSAIRRVIKRIKREAKRNKPPRVKYLGLEFGKMTSNSALNKFVGHYTAGPVDKDDADCERLCRLYHQSHLNKNWAGEGYHYCISREGTIYPLRPAWAVGAHTYGSNTGSIGIMMHGSTGDKPSRAQARSLRWLLDNAHTPAFKSEYRASAMLSSLRACGHSELYPTGCPGKFMRCYKTKGKKR